MKDICKNCGGWKGLHKWDTKQCPFNGEENEVWMESRFEDAEEADQLAALQAENEELAESRQKFATLATKRLEEIAALKEALRWAWNNLGFEVPYPDPESEYGQCVVCGNRDFDHKPNCEALRRKQEAAALLAKLEAK